MAGPRVGGATQAAVDDMAVLQFRVGGWFVVDGVFSGDECDRLVELLESVGPEVPLGEPSAGPIAFRHMAHTVDADLRAAATDRRWYPLVEPFLGPDVRLLWDQGVTKPAGTRTELPWHQDSGYMPLIPEEFVVCWLALDDASADGGCLWVLPGSHHRGTLRHWGDAADRFRVGYEGDDRGVPVPATKGSVVVLSSLLLHRSGPNGSDRDRPAWVLQFCPAWATSALSGGLLDDRLQVAADGVWLDQPAAERALDLDRVLGNYDRR